MVALHDLGNRICIIGLSSSGKSTLAQALGKKLNLNILHLDQIAHIPNTDWAPRDKALMTADHQAFLTDHTDWVIEGNPETRTLLQVNIEDAAVADEVFSMLMGDKVGPRKEFIEENATYVRNLDI